MFLKESYSNIVNYSKETDHLSPVVTLHYTLHYTPHYTLHYNLHYTLHYTLHYITVTVHVISE